MDIFCGDSLEMLKTMESSSVDSMVTDPPAGISFMLKKWDDDKGGPREWRAWLCEVMSEALRVLKPGSHGLVWSIPRTSHWTGMALERAGFEIRDAITHHFGSGFPKNRSLKEVLDGFGTALKPSSEIWWLVRKPFKGSIASNVLKHGTGGINIAGCRVGDEEITTHNTTFLKGLGVSRPWHKDHKDFDTKHKGRWPTNTLLTHSAQCSADKCVDGCPVLEIGKQSGESKQSGSADIPNPYHQKSGRSFNTSSVIKGSQLKDSGTAARFFPCFRYQAKPSQAEKEAGLSALPLKRSNKLNEGGMQARRDAKADKAIESQGLDAKGRTLIRADGSKTLVDRFIPQFRANNHPCLTPGNKVLTLTGWVDISLISDGDFVYSSDGQYHEVSFSSAHYCDGKTYKIKVNGLTTEATANHPFLVFRDESIFWMEARWIKSGDLLLSPLLEPNAPDTVKLKGGYEKWVLEDRKAGIHLGMDTPRGRDTIASTTKESFDLCTVLSGKKNTATSQKDSKFITSMKTGKITQLQISSLLVPLSISGYTLVARSEMVSGSNHVGCVVCSRGSVQRDGISPKKDGRFTDDARDATSQKLSSLKSYAMHPVESIEELNYSGMVYNLTIDGNPAFQTEVGMSHNTVKPIELMRWLCRLVTPPGGMVLDPFMGSGTTGCAAVMEGFNFTGIDQNKEYCDIARKRIEWWRIKTSRQVSKNEPLDEDGKPRQGGLFN